MTRRYTHEHQASQPRDEESPEVNAVPNNYERQASSTDLVVGQLSGTLEPYQPALVMMRQQAYGESAAQAAQWLNEWISKEGDTERPGTTLALSKDGEVLGVHLSHLGSFHYSLPPNVQAYLARHCYNPHKEIMLVTDCQMTRPDMPELAEELQAAVTDSFQQTFSTFGSWLGMLFIHQIKVADYSAEHSAQAAGYKPIPILLPSPTVPFEDWQYWYKEHLPDIQPPLSHPPVIDPNQVATSLYDAYYRAGGKDYAAEVAMLDRLAQQRRPGARTWCDVACGTGRHLELLTRLGYEGFGVDYSSGMLALAQARLGRRAVQQGDMKKLNVGDRKFDVVSCLFGGAGIACKDQAELYTAVANLARIAKPGGVLIIEPWRSPASLPGKYTTEAFSSTFSSHFSPETNRHSRWSYRQDNDGQWRARSALDIRFTSPGLTDTHLYERLEGALFWPEQIASALERIGCQDIQFYPDGLTFGTDRGLFVASI